MNNEYVIRGNSAILKCSIPSFVADFVAVVEWSDDAGNSYTLNEPHAVQPNQFGLLFLPVHPETVCTSGQMRCNNIHPQSYIPQSPNQFPDNHFDFVYAIRMSSGQSVLRGGGGVRVRDQGQYGGAEVQHSQLRGGLCESRGVVGQRRIRVPAGRQLRLELFDDGCVRWRLVRMYGHCSASQPPPDIQLPSPNVRRDSVEYVLFTWRAKNENISINTELKHTPTVVNQFYGADILMEYVIRGNAAVLKCSIPSFVADFVRVESWIDEQGTVLQPPSDNNYGAPASALPPCSCTCAQRTSLRVGHTNIISRTSPHTHPPHHNQHSSPMPFVMFCLFSAYFRPIHRRCQLSTSFTRRKF